ncbi:hypothetical protein TNCT_65211 [Trichonephila clavata]|uniref:Uncharacterized protein n=1 Tax=Trichonephila clavata TaxID=2740835 RepID=A0A8X6LJK3_TRICU|nr:hypothetical protein TNCT_65211 [Trichonephila clavata]
MQEAIHSGGSRSFLHEKFATPEGNLDIRKVDYEKVRIRSWMRINYCPPRFQTDVAKGSFLPPQMTSVLPWIPIATSLERKMSFTLAT